MDNSELSSPLLYSPAFSGDDVGDADDRYDSLGKTSKQHTSSRSLTSSLLATSGSSSGGDPERGEGRSSGIDAPAMEHKMSGFMLAVLIFFTCLVGQ